MQPQVYKQEGAEGHGRPLEKSGSHVIMSLHTWPLLWILTVAPFIYEKKKKTRGAEQARARQVTQLLGPPTAPTVGSACFLVPHLGCPPLRVPSEGGGDKNELIWLPCRGCLAEKPPSSEATPHQAAAPLLSRSSCRCVSRRRLAPSLLSFLGNPRSAWAQSGDLEMSWANETDGKPHSQANQTHSAGQKRRTPEPEGVGEAPQTASASAADIALCDISQVPVAVANFKSSSWTLER